MIDLESTDASREFAASCGPKLLIEIHPVNLRVYGLAPADVVDELDRRGYGVETLAGERPTPENRDKVLERAFEFIARPR